MLSDAAHSAPVDPAHFRHVLGHYPAGVVAVTGRRDDGEPVGMVVTSFTSVSLDPPLVAFMPMRTSTTFEGLRGSGAFCVNVLSSAQEDISRRLSAKGGDKFAEISWRPAETGSPVIEGAVAWVDCSVAAIHEEGDHYIVVGRVHDLAVQERASPLLFFQGGYGEVASPALAASGAHDLVEHFRLVDRLRPAMAGVSRELGVEIVVTALLTDEVVALATSGHPDPHRLPTRVGQRMPYQPPLGAVFAAWSDSEHWLAGIAEPSRARVRRELTRVRERGWSASVAGPSYVHLERALARLPLEASDPNSMQDIEGLLAPSSSVRELENVSAHDSIPVRSVSVPILAADSSAKLVLTAYGLPDQSTGLDLDRYVDALRSVAAVVPISQRTTTVSALQGGKR